MLKNVVKFLGIVLLGFVVLYVIRYFQYGQNKDVRAIQNNQKTSDNTKRASASDPYGGVTPEATLKLFIDALKKGDTNLAAKYFVADMQDQWAQDLSEMRQKGLLTDLLKDLETLKIEKNNGTEAVFAPTDNTELLMKRNSKNENWKISNL